MTRRMTELEFEMVVATFRSTEMWNLLEMLESMEDSCDLDLLVLEALRRPISALRCPRILLALTRIM
jgi:hypothetical protein